MIVIMTMTMMTTMMTVFRMIIIKMYDGLNYCNAFVIRVHVERYSLSYKE